MSEQPKLQRNEKNKIILLNGEKKSFEEHSVWENRKKEFVPYFLLTYEQNHLFVFINLSYYVEKSSDEIPTPPPPVTSLFPIHARTKFMCPIWRQRKILFGIPMKMKASKKKEEQWERRKYSN